MPTTLKLVDHPAVQWIEPKITTTKELLENACPRQYRRCQRVVQSSFTRSQLRTNHVSASDNGFVWAAYHAYSKHHHLVIRPDDIWFAILTQLSFFINANAEQLRTFFVHHTGQKELEVISAVRDFGALAVQMTHLVAKNVIDPQLRDWVMPSFTTTTDTDRVVGAILFMGAMQSYFSYKMTVRCGLPSVTLLGEVEDWKEILNRLEKIELLGEEPRQFAKMLRPILGYMVRSFEDPTEITVTQFWNTIVHRNPVGSGTDYLSGWLTAFCFWDSDGKAKQGVQDHSLFLDVRFPTVEITDVPAAFASVLVTVDDDGDVYPATMVAGLVGIAALALDAPGIPPGIPPGSRERETLANGSSASETPDESIRDAVQPVSGWWMCENEAPEESEARAAEMTRLQDEVEIACRDDNPDTRWGKDFFKMLHRLEELRAY